MKNSETTSRETTKGMENRLTSKVQEFEDYKMYEFYENGATVGNVVIMWCGYDYYQVTHVDVRKQLYKVVITKLMNEYRARGKKLLCEEVDKEETPIYGGFGFLDRNRYA